MQGSLLLWLVTLACELCSQIPLYMKLDVAVSDMAPEPEAAPVGSTSEKTCN